MSIQESNHALLVTDKLLHKALTQIKGFQVDGQMVVDQAHEIAQLVSQTLQQHGRNALVISPLLLSVATKIQETMNNGQVPQWEHKHKLAKHISKAVLMDTEDEDGPLTGSTIFVKPPKGAVPVTPAPSNSKASTSDVTKEVKKDKGKEKAVVVKEPELYDPPCTKCSDEHKCVVIYGIRGLPVKACSRCFTLKSKVALVSKSKLASRMTRVTFRACPLTPVVESQDAMDDADVAVATHEDIEMSHEADAEWPTHIAAMTPMEPEINHPAAIASADDFPADNWQEDPDTIVVPLPSPPCFLSPLPHLTEPTILDVESMVHNWVVALAAQVAAMEVAD
ncbi:hypothetical protein BDR04DRAFT_1153633 [Suillus decipiens]|nr:hypothetical protein BDR04DRAFT_1153633 [Suillus decipiens]